MDFSIEGECRTSDFPNKATDAVSSQKYNKEVVVPYSLFFTWCSILQKSGFVFCYEF